MDVPMKLASTTRSIGVAGRALSFMGGSHRAPGVDEQPQQAAGHEHPAVEREGRVPLSATLKAQGFHVVGELPEEDLRNATTGEADHVAQAEERSQVAASDVAHRRPPCGQLNVREEVADLAEQ